VKYSIDTSALIEAWIRLYPPIVFPSIWQKLEEIIVNGDLRATEEVLHEIEKKEDQLHKWAKGNSQLFVPLDGNIQITVADILAKHPRLVDERKNRSQADPFVIALALNNTVTVVTLEQSKNLNKPRIPDVCSAMNIKCITLVEMFIELKWKL
jgi:hypothetical protein